MKKDDIDFFYKSIGDSLKKNWIGNTAWIITSNFSALKLLGLSTSKKIKLYNGALECRFVKYDLYKGSKKTKYSQNQDSLPEILD
jgi:putative N6-adenine-specific DNA methylase